MSPPGLYRAAQVKAQHLCTSAYRTQMFAAACTYENRNTHGIQAKHKHDAILHPTHRTAPSHLRQLTAFGIHDEVPLSVNLRRNLEHVQEQAERAAVARSPFPQEASLVW